MSGDGQNIPPGEVRNIRSPFRHSAPEAGDQNLLEEMPMKLMLGTAIVVVGVSAAVAAQSGRMSQPAMGDKMSTTYSGCVEAVNHGGAFLLTRIGDDHEKAMKGDMTMKKDMGTMDKDMRGDHMTPSTVALTGSPDLKKHIGQRVTVTGSVSAGSTGTMRDDLDTLTVRSLKVVAKSCSR
jgi:hypothetical protein